MVTSTQPRPTSRRAEILSAAVDAFGSGGWHGTRIEDVAAAAGVSKGLVFNYWDTKDALFDEVRLRLSERFRGWVEHAIVGAEDAAPLDTLAAALASAADFFEQYPASAVVFSPIHSPRGPETADAARDLFAETLDDYIAPALGTDDPQILVLGDALVTGAAGGLLGASISMPAFTTSEASELVRTFCLAGLSNIGPRVDPGRRPPRPTRPVTTTNGRVTARERKRLLLEAAFDVFWRDGYEAARLEDIAEAAGVTKAVIFKHWDSKQDLFVDLRAALFAEIEDVMLEAAERSATLMGKIVSASDALIDWHYAKPQAQRVLAPVPTLPAEAQTDAGTSDLMRAALSYPVVAASAHLLPLVAPALTGAGRSAIRAMHEGSIHPAIVKKALGEFVSGAITAVVGDVDF